MKTKAVRLYGKQDVRLEEFELPSPGDDEILARIITNSICMSSHKAALQGADHKRVPSDIARNPVILGHEFSGTIVEVGKKWQQRFSPGDRFSIQPALNYQGSLDAPGYSFRYIGGNATHIVIPSLVMECGCLLPYTGNGFFPASLSEPMSCIIGAFHASYHTTAGSYVHEMGICEGGSMAMLASAGPMGLEAIDYALHGPRRPALLVVTDIDARRLDWARSIFPPRQAQQQGVKLVYLDTSGINDPVAHLRQYTGGEGFDDVLIFAPVAALIEQGDRLLKPHGCLNFFAGPGTPDFRASINFYNVHYASTHIIGTSGGNTADMEEALELMARDVITPAVMVTHIGGLDCVPATILALPQIPGGKKLIYTPVKLPLTAIADFSRLGETDPFFAALGEITQRHKGLWSLEAEEYLLAHAEQI